MELAAQLLLDHADLGMPLARGRRSFPLLVFPCTLVYRKLDTGSALIVRHRHRRPSLGGGRS
ncbi:MAG: hypothetical protein LDL16_01730 [Thiobacillus sp.]|nr:hypothetical protein [Thiobacillus sp.]